MTITATLTKIKDTLRGVAPEAKAILYGSQARGDARADSDIDLLILLPKASSGKDFVKKQGVISDRLYDLSLDLGVDISPFIVEETLFRARKTPFTVNIANEGIRLI